MIKMSTGLLSSDPRPMAYGWSASLHGLPCVCARWSHLAYGHYSCWTRAHANDLILP